MKLRNLLYPFLIASFASYGAGVLAQDNEDELDTTMDVAEEGEAPDNATEPLALPEDASEQGVESSAEGLETANEAREKGREFGEATAEEAREQGRETGRSAAEDAREGGRAAAEDARERGAGAAPDVR